MHSSSSLLRKLIVLATISLSIKATSAQSLVKSRQSAADTYIFKITNQQAEAVGTNFGIGTDASLFDKLIDSIPMKLQYDFGQLPPGHYLETKIVRNKMESRLVTVPNCVPEMVNNSGDFIVMLRDSSGALVSDATVTLGGKELSYNSQLGAYRLARTCREGWLTISWHGLTQWYNISVSGRAPRIKQLYSSFMETFPGRKVVKPIQKPLYYIGFRIAHFGWYGKRFLLDLEHLGYNMHRWFNKSYRCDAIFITNKPLYKPTDSVHVKLIVARKNRKLINKTLTVYARNGNDIKRIATITPYRKGFYKLDFKISQELLKNKHGVLNLDFKTERGNYLFSNDIEIEEYELKKYSFSAVCKTSNQYRGKPFEITLTGRDENNLPVYDATYSIVITSGNVANTFIDKEMLRDTLLVVPSTKMNAESVTTFTVPDSIFPSMNLDYKVDVTFRTADNELVKASNSCKFYHLLKEITFTNTSDSVRIQYTRNGDATTDTLTVMFRDFKHRDSTVLVWNGSTVKLSRKYQSIIARCGTTEKTYNIEESKFWQQGNPDVSYSYNRDYDSLHFQLVNPRKLPVSYFLFKGNRLVKFGTDTSIAIHQKSASKKFTYCMILSYQWNGNEVCKHVDIPLYKYVLNIAVNEKPSIVPGQKLDYDIMVTNFKGKPVKNTDLTAWAFTNKFGDKQRLDLFSRDSRTFKRTFRQEYNSHDAMGVSTMPIMLRIAERAKLDSIEYYRFAFPGHYPYKYSYITADSTTQVAVFVLRNGEILQPHVVTIDFKPVYYSWTTTAVPYSFVTDTMEHTITVRTKNDVVTIDKVKLEQGKKTIISVDVDRCFNQNLIDMKRRTYVTTATRNSMLNEFEWREYSKTTMKFGQVKPLNSLVQGANVYPLDYYNYQSQLVGPVFEREASMYSIDKNALKNTSSFDFTFEPGFQYHVGKNMLKLYPLKDSIISRVLARYSSACSITDEAITLPNLMKPNPIVVNLSLRKTIENYSYESRYGDIYMSRSREHYNSLEMLIVENKKDSNDVAFFSSSVSTIFNVPGGTYRLVWITTKHDALLIDSVQITNNTRTFVNFDAARQTTFSATSRYSHIVDSIYTLLYNREKNNQNMLSVSDFNRTKTSVSSNELSKDNTWMNSSVWSMPTNNCNGCLKVCGTVIDGIYGGGLPGANVVVKGTTRGTQTNMDGRYCIYAPSESSVLVFSSIGYEHQEIKVGNRYAIDLTLKQAVKQIEEVVRVGYGGGRRSDITGSVSRRKDDFEDRPVVGIDQAMQGKAAGVSIRGIGSINNNEPLYVVDGVPQSTTPKIDPSNIESISVLKDASATALYGARAANGVVVIKTKGKNGAANPFADMNAGNISQYSGNRTNFKDDAFWQTALVTDRHGKASFTATFPDDITSWRTNIVAFNKRGYAGLYRGTVNAMKPLTSQLFLPQFLVEGDSSWCIGKSINYMPDSQRVSISTTVDGKSARHDTILQHLLIDSIALVGKKAGDSLSISYNMSRNDGYADGEKRSVPVMRRGREETVGTFMAIRDSSLRTIIPVDSTKPVEIVADNLPLSSMLKEIENIYQYPYLCNEQTASKLIALVNEKRIDSVLGTPFKHGEEVGKLIKKLEENQNGDGLWGWWNKNQTEEWITLHVVNALMMAREEGFGTSNDRNSLGQRLAWMLQTDKFDDKTSILLLLLRLQPGYNAEPYLKYAREEAKKGIYRYFTYMELLQKMKLPVSLDTMKLYLTHPATFQLAYSTKWNGCYVPYHNDMQLNISAYRLLKRDTTTSPANLQMLRDYLLGQRKRGFWANTYEAATIISTILPDMMRGNVKDTATNLVLIADGKQHIINRFPHRDTLPATKKIELRKSGISPVYFYSMQKRFNANPVAEVAPFTVKTFIKNMGDKRVRLKSGEPVEITVTVNLTHASNYVMIDVPIPAGCSYTSKPQPDSYREYKKDRVEIYCTYLREGQHTFTIPVTPRYNGVYSLNPARAELMYLPVEHGQEGMKKVEVR